MTKTYFLTYISRPNFYKHVLGSFHGTLVLCFRWSQNDGGVGGVVKRSGKRMRLQDELEGFPLLLYSCLRPL